jgi:hypothetical protein
MVETSGNTASEASEKSVAQKIRPNSIEKTGSAH